MTCRHPRDHSRAAKTQTFARPSCKSVALPRAMSLPPSARLHWQGRPPIADAHHPAMQPALQSRSPMLAMFVMRPPVLQLASMMSRRCHYSVVSASQSSFFAGQTALDALGACLADGRQRRRTYPQRLPVAGKSKTMLSRRPVSAPRPRLRQRKESSQWLTRVSRLRSQGQ